MYKTNDKIVCVNVGRVYGGVADHLTKGKVYEVLEDQTGSGSVVYVRDNRGERYGFYAERFEAAPVAPVLDFTKPLETQDGREVTLITASGRGTYPVLAYIEDSKQVTSFTAEGKYLIGETDDRDLRNVAPKPVEREAYVNVNAVGSSPLSTGGLYEDRAKADSSAGPYRVGCMKIKLVHGQFDD